MKDNICTSQLFCGGNGRVILIFDYFEGNRVTGYTFTGVLPVFDKDKSIYFFASHKHQDHFDMNILKLAEDYEDIHFILSKDTK